MLRTSTLDTDQLQALLVSKHYLEQRLALSLSARPEVWRFIYKQQPELAFTLAQNPSIPQDLADELAAHPNPRVRLMVARHGEPSFYALKQLSEDKEAAVRLAIAKRPDLDGQLQGCLFKDKDAGVQLAAQLYQQAQQPFFARASSW